jgi:short-chain fatty acids transporter
MLTDEPRNIRAPEETSETRFVRAGMAMADWSQRWFPDAFIFALIGVAIVFVAGLATGSPTRDLVKYFGDGFWSLIPLTMQMALIIVGGYVVASSPPVHALIVRLARIPRTPRSAVVTVALFSMLTSLISWGFSLVISGILVRAIVRNIPRVDYRAIGAAGYLGLGTVWALGLSSSPALLMATQASIPAALLRISGVIPLSQTIYSWPSLTTAAIIIAASTVVAFLTMPKSSAKTAESFGVTEGFETPKLEPRTLPAEWLEYAPLLSVGVGVLGCAYLAQVVATRGIVAAVDLNTFNLLFIMAGLLLHWRPRSFIRAVNNAVPATAGVLIQFPFYGGIFGIVTMSHISSELAEFFVRISTHGSFPVLVAIYSAFLGIFVPSAGSKWIIEAPYVLQAAKDLQVNLGWVVQIYNTAESLPNLINPFFMLPILGILKIRARDMVGYALLYFMVNSVLVMFLVWFLARSLPYIPPIGLR